jgi:hypothetical protein
VSTFVELDEFEKRATVHRASSVARGSDGIRRLVSACLCARVPPVLTGPVRSAGPADAAALRVGLSGVAEAALCRSIL